MKWRWIAAIGCLTLVGCGFGESEDSPAGSGTGTAGTPGGSLAEADFAALNTNGDDSLNSDEWAAGGLDEQAFIDFDDDGNGLLSESETDEAKAAADYVPCDEAACADLTSSPCQMKTCLGGKGDCIERSDDTLLGLPCDDGDLCTTAEYCKDDGTCGIFGDGQSGTEFCQFDELQQGKDLGNHVKNFAMKTTENCAYWMHQNCGTEKKVIWMILGTGW